MHFTRLLLAVASLLVLDVAGLAVKPRGETDLLEEWELPGKRADAYGPSSGGCSAACSFLNVLLKGKVSYPQSTIYKFQESRYWSQQQASVIPTCRIAPTCAEDVSITIQVLERQQCKFAVKSGGHAAFAGASNINGGVTIDLLNLNQVVISPHKTKTTVGAGARWYDVYSILQKEGLAVVGGRVADIGVGGLTLGGGISFFSARYGWACDNVHNYEIVLADGSIENVNYRSNPDLYFALRGGGNNFGIVTRFDMFTFKQGNMWGGSTFHFLDAEPAMHQAFEDFNINVPSDPYASVILAYAYVQSLNLFAMVGDYQYGKPVANPPILKNFTAITPIQSTLRLTNLTDLTVEFNNSNPGGNRQTYWTFMVKNSAPLMSKLVDIFIEECGPIKNVSGIIPSYVMQPISTAMTSHFSQNGGNALGISVGDGPLNLINIAISWSSTADDTRVLAAARNMVNRGNATAYSMDLGHPYLYQNYAALEQDVFNSYGPKNKQRLLKVREEYDPGALFTKLQPGYFKLA